MTDTHANHLRRRLAAVCHARGISQRELARRSGVHFVTVNRVFRGNQVPSMTIAFRLADAAGIPAEKIFAEFSDDAIDGRKRRR